MSNKPNQLILFAMICVWSASCLGSESAISQEDMERISLEVLEAVERGDYRNAVDLSRSLSNRGDPEAIFATGMLMLEWIQDSSAIERPTFSSEDALFHIRKAASLGVVQAAGVLRSGHQFGRYSLPKDEEKARCWRLVELGENISVDC